jgi:nucleotide sugar dehydrogenase
MALAVADAREDGGGPAFDVVGVELDSESGSERAQALQAGRLPVDSSDPKLQAALQRANDTGNLTATVDPAVYEEASVVLVDVHLDVLTQNGRRAVDFTGLRAAVRTLGERLPSGALVIVETTVPPGTCANVVAPELEAAGRERGLEREAILLAHSYERVMPGPDYFDSIVNFWRVYAGHSSRAADACERFLSRVVNVSRYPLTRVSSTTASEMGKVLENSYRATTIAFMEEWGRFAEAINVDLFEVIEAIRMRPTHSNLRQPGFGVGGYCLTKDPLLAEVGARDLFGLSELEFAMSSDAVLVNEAMPLVSVDRLESLLGGLEGRRLLLLGVTYRPGVGDTRSSPSEVFARAALSRGAEVVAHDPLVTEWEGPVPVTPALPDPGGFDAVVLAVAHPEYLKLDMAAWLKGSQALLFDANAVLSHGSLRELADTGSRVWAIGRGEVAAS